MKEKSKIISRGGRVFTMLLAFVLGNTVLAAAAPTPVPGDAFETNGVSGAMSLKEAGPDDTIRPNGGDGIAIKSADLTQTP
jgi:hypothetical protein